MFKESWMIVLSDKAEAPNEAEIERRRDDVVKRMLATPPQPKKAKPKA